MKGTLSIALVAACSLVATGCLDARPRPPVPAPARAASPDIVPPGTPPLASRQGEEWRFEASVDYASLDFEGDPELSLWSLGLNWYFLPVDHSDAPHALQPIVQKSSGVGFIAGRGEFDFGSSLGEGDISTWGLQGRLVLGDDSPAPGLGCRFAFGKTAVDDLPIGAGVTDELESTTFNFALLGYVPQLEGLILEIGGAIEKSELGGDREVVDGPVFGARYYREIADGQWLDASATVGFLFFRTGLSAEDDDDLVDWEIALRYYPLHELGLGVSFGGRNFDEIDNDSNRVALEVSYSLEKWVPGMDLDFSWQKTEKDDEKETALVFGVEYRF